jgi:hypothetical protein
MYRPQTQKQDLAEVVGLEVIASSMRVKTREIDDFLKEV